jgi:hypothetical protein
MRLPCTQPSEWQLYEENNAKIKQSKIKQTQRKHIKVSPIVHDKQE